jgi:uncharacterized protein
MSTILLDTSFVFALNHPGDKNHLTTVRFLSDGGHTYLLAEVVLTEAAFLLNRAGGLPAVLRFLDSLLRTDATLQSITLADIERAKDIMASYPTARFDFVGCCLMALSERLTITKIGTYDRRDFSIFRPNHCDYLELLP